MVIQLDEVLWEFSKCYREKFLAEHLDVELSADMAAIAMLRAMEVTGDVSSTGLETGPLVTLRSALN